MALGMGRDPKARTEIAARMRHVGMDRFVFGSDFPVMEGSLAQLWPRYTAEMPLTAEEFRTIANNVLPFARINARGRGAD
jgi:predicted TIM-barrel fold metal-dependent hydrolase